jgi:hypothetical protein
MHIVSLTLQETVHVIVTCSARLVSLMTSEGNVEIKDRWTMVAKFANSMNRWIEKERLSSSVAN